MQNYTESFAYRFSSDIRHAREGLNLTQSAVAESIGIDHRTYIRYENGTRIPRADIFLRLVFLFGLNINQYEEGVTTGDTILSR